MRPDCYHPRSNVTLSDCESNDAMMRADARKVSNFRLPRRARELVRYGRLTGANRLRGEIFQFGKRPCE